MVRCGEVLSYKGYACQSQVVTCWETERSVSLSFHDCQVTSSIHWSAVANEMKENKPVEILTSMLLTKVHYRHKMNMSMDVQSPAVIFPWASSSLIFSEFSTLWNNHGSRSGKVHCLNSLLGPKKAKSFRYVQQFCTTFKCITVSHDLRTGFHHLL